MKNTTKSISDKAEKVIFAIKDLDSLCEKIILQNAPVKECKFTLKGKYITNRLNEIESYLRINKKVCNIIDIDWTTGSDLVVLTKHCTVYIANVNGRL